MLRCSCGPAMLTSATTLRQKRLGVSRLVPLQAPIGTKRRLCTAQAGNQLDGWTSPSKLLDDQVQMMNNIDKMMEQVDRDVDRAMREAQLDMQRALDRQQVELLTDGQSIKIESQQSNGQSGFRSYQKVEVYIGGPTGYNTFAAAPTPAPAVFSPLLLAGIILGALYAVITTAFFKNFDLTIYKDQGRWMLAPMWPFLLIFNARFRNQFFSAIRGVKPDLDEPPPA